MEVSVGKVKLATASCYRKKNTNRTRKINGKLIPVTASASGEYANGELRIRTRLLDDEGDAGLQMQELIVAGPRMKDEFGFWGYTTCGNSEA